MYSWYLTEHAIKRCEERFGIKIDTLVYKLDHSVKISDNLRRFLRRTTKSKRHLQQLERNSGYFFRRHKNILFVLDNLRVVTVYEIPEKFRR